MHDEEIGTWWTSAEYKRALIQRTNRYRGPTVTDEEVRAARTRHRMRLDNPLTSDI